MIIFFKIKLRIKRIKIRLNIKNKLNLNKVNLL